MDVRQAYNSWAEQYDTNINKTRDLEALTIRSVLADMHFKNCLEIGCGTGKNTEWLVSKSDQLTSVDFSEEMLAKAKTKVTDNNISFHQADIMNEWTFVKNKYDLITFSLILEHIENLDDIFQKCAQAISPRGYLYIGELHPFKQYQGSKARFETTEGPQIVNCYTHHISDFTNSAKSHGFDIIEIKEFFDDGNRDSIPRILGLLFKEN